MNRKNFQTILGMILLLALTISCTQLEARKHEKELRAKFADKLSALIPGLSEENLTKRDPARAALVALSAKAGAPGSGEQTAFCKALAEQLGGDTPQSAQVSFIRELERIGGAESVSALAKALAANDKELSETARRALQKNSSPEADKALRKALIQATDAERKVGLINALGNRRDENSVDLLLTTLLKEPNGQVAGAAARALGDIADGQAVKNLLLARRFIASRDKKSSPLLNDITIACIDAGDNLLKRGQNEAAVSVFAQLNSPQEPVHIRIAAVRGLALAQPDEAAPLILKALKDDNPRIQAAAVQTAQNVPGRELTSLLANSLESLDHLAQIQVLGLLGDRGDPFAEKQVIRMTREANLPVRLAAIETLGRLASETAFNNLFGLALSSQQSTRDAARKALTLANGSGVDAILKKNAALGETDRRVLAIESIKNRRTPGTTPSLLQYAAKDNPTVQKAAIEALGEMAGEKELPYMAEILVKTKDAQCRKAAEAAVRSICRRTDNKSASAKILVGEIANADAKGQASVLNVLSAVGDDISLAAVRKSLVGNDPALRSAAIRALSDWPNFAAAKDIAVVAADKKTTLPEHVLAMRGLMNLVNNAKSVATSQKIDVCAAALKTTRRSEEKKIILSALGKLPDAKSAEIIAPYLKDPALKNEAALAALALAKSLQKGQKMEARALAEKILPADVSANIKKEAQKIVNSIPKRGGLKPLVKGQGTSNPRQPQTPPQLAPGLHKSKAKKRGRVKVMLLTGQMNKYHKWIPTTELMRKSLEDTGRFAVDVLVSPPKGSDLSGFAPKFSDYQTIVLNYDGDTWSEKTSKAFEQYVADGGGLVSVHSTDNAFKDWKAFNEMIALGGWGGRTADAGPYAKWCDGKIALIDGPGKCGSHGARNEFLITFRAPDHPIAKGLPKSWRHAADELYDSLRGPAKNLTMVGTAFSDPKNKGTGENEPMLMAISYGKGRIFHTTLGHDIPAMNCVGFQTTLARGTEWSATGEVTLKKPEDFPTAKKVSVRE